MAAFSNPQYKMVVAACGAQMGKTECQLNILAHRFDDGPYVPALFIGPTEKNVRSISKDRFEKMLSTCKNLHSKLEKGNRNTILEKFIAGVRLGFAWAGSPTELASHPAGLVLVDEVDRMAKDVGGEGDPIMLARARTKNYSDAKIGIFSTPTIEGQSAIWKHWESGTMGKWAWPCPECDSYFIPEFKLLKWPEKSTPEDALYDARLVCPECGYLIESRHKEAMNAKGRYMFHVEHGDELENIGFEPPRNPTASYWVSGLCSPWQSFGDIANVMLSALRTGDQGTIQGALNTYCGELYRMTGEAPAWAEVKSLVQDYPAGEAPEGVQLITCGVDCQKNGLYYTVRGWGFNSESWKLESGFIPGQTEHDAVWVLLARLLDKTYSGWAIDCMFIDSGYRPGEKFRRPDNIIYKFVRQHYGRAFACKGRDTMDKPLSESKIDVTISGKVHRGGVRLWHVNTDYYKTWIHSRLRWPDDMEGGFHLDRSTDDDYCKQLVNEEVIVSSTGRRFWNEIGPNHYLDCEVYCAAAASRLQVHTLPQLKTGKLTEKVGKEPDKPSFIKKTGSSFIRR